MGEISQHRMEKMNLSTQEVQCGLSLPLFAVGGEPEVRSILISFPALDPQRQSTSQAGWLQTPSSQAPSRSSVDSCCQLAPGDFYSIEGGAFSCRADGGACS